MNQTLPQLNQNLSLAEEYSYLISLPVLSELEAERMAKILEIANSDESLNCLIEEIEMSDYLESKQLNKEYEFLSKENRFLQRLFRLIAK